MNLLALLVTLLVLLAIVVSALYIAWEYSRAPIVPPTEDDDPIPHIKGRKS